MTDPRTGFPVLVPGQVLPGGYNIERLVGKGGYGAVYAANGPSGPCAIKEFRGGPEMPRVVLRERFDTESRVLQAFSGHPCIPGFIAGFEYEETLFLAEEFIHGSTLHSVLRKGAQAFSLGESLAWLCIICRTLDQLHKRLILYQDLKPANILITPERSPVLVDFGSARPYAGIGANPKLLFGTHGYIAPEILTNPQQQLDYRSDVFSLGCLSYTLLTGEMLSREQILGDASILPPSHMLLRFRPETAGMPQQWFHSLDELLGQVLQRQPERRLADLKYLYQRLNGLLASVREAQRVEEILSPIYRRLAQQDEVGPPAAGTEEDFETEPALIRWEPEKLVFGPLSSRGELATQPVSVYTLSGKPIQGTASCVGIGLECVEKGFRGSQFRIRVRVNPRVIADQYGVNRWAQGLLLLRTKTLIQIRIPCLVLIVRPNDPMLTAEQSEDPILQEG